MTAVRTVRVRRTGGFIGRSVEGHLDLTGPDDRAREARDLLASVDLTTAPTGTPKPDMYSFCFEVDDVTATVPEHLLTPPLRRLADLVLSG